MASYGRKMQFQIQFSKGHQDSGGTDGKESTCSVADLFSIPGLGRPCGKGKATHSSILAWKIPWMEEPDRLQSLGHKELDTTE